MITLCYDGFVGDTINFLWQFANSLPSTHLSPLCLPLMLACNALNATRRGFASLAACVVDAHYFLSFIAKSKASPSHARTISFPDSNPYTIDHFFFSSPTI